MNDLGKGPIDKTKYQSQRPRPPSFTEDDFEVSPHTILCKARKPPRRSHFGPRIVIE